MQQFSLFKYSPGTLKKKKKKCTKNMVLMMLIIIKDSLNKAYL